MEIKTDVFMKSDVLASEQGVDWQRTQDKRGKEKRRKHLPFELFELTTLRVVFSEQAC